MIVQGQLAWLQHRRVGRLALDRGSEHLERRKRHGSKKANGTSSLAASAALGRRIHQRHRWHPSRVIALQVEAAGTLAAHLHPNRRGPW